MAGVGNEDEKSRVAATMLLQDRILLPYEAEAEEALRTLERIGDAIPLCAKDLLMSRWKQIRDMIQQALVIHGVRRV